MQGTEQPLPPTTFFVLFALATGSKHGYGIMLEARKLSDDRFRMGPATLYTTVQRLVSCSWIEEAVGPKDQDPRRRYYQLTGPGRSALSEEMQRMEALVRKSKALRLQPRESAS
jgi:DNA-binding PadR family transcriptional regulator